ncbi:Protein BTN [Venustampulla echinocandica]|uniref:Protein BTN n=1 Tax=Venustampulla echinocandica TaxID=2656787 RepID=A0A370TXH3_9HELO|nr:Protein BTN [Venustampulla echinocandica]RDL40213.1 Protein BTN [Venustampulla echinocandica]
MHRSPSSSGLLPLPGSPGSSWPVYKARFKAIFKGADPPVLVAFWLFGLINNVSYVIILSAALDLVGPTIPKSVVLLADVMPSFITKLIAPYFIHAIPYSMRVLVMTALSTGGMFLIALAPNSIPIKLFGIALSSVSSGAGELSFLGLTHYYGPFSLAAWGSGTGGAGLVGAGLYVFLTSTLGLAIKKTLLTCAFLPFIMPIAFFLVLPLGPLRRAASAKDYTEVNPDDDSTPTIIRDDYDEEDISHLPISSASESLLAPGPSIASSAYASHSPVRSGSSSSLSTTSNKPTLLRNLRRARRLFIPYMLPLLLVYIAEYTINQGVSPTLLFDLPSTPFTAYRSFYPFYNLLYQLGVFVARSSSPFIRLHNLYLPSFLQVANLLLLISQSLWWWIPSIYIVFIIIFWEGLLGGAVYVNTFAEIMENIPEGDREFSLGATSVSDSGGICIAGFLGMVLEVVLCDTQVRNGRDWCRTMSS